MIHEQPAEGEDALRALREGDFEDSAFARLPRGSVFKEFGVN